MTRFSLLTLSLLLALSFTVSLLIAKPLIAEDRPYVVDSVMLNCPSGDEKVELIMLANSSVELAEQKISAEAWQKMVAKGGVEDPGVSRINNDNQFTIGYDNKNHMQLVKFYWSNSVPLKNQASLVQLCLGAKPVDSELRPVTAVLQQVKL